MRLVQRDAQIERDLKMTEVHRVEDLSRPQQRSLQSAVLAPAAKMDLELGLED